MEETEVRPTIALLEEDVFAPVSALGHVVRDARRDDSCDARHGGEDRLAIWLRQALIGLASPYFPRVIGNGLLLEVQVAPGAEPLRVVFGRLGRSSTWNGLDATSTIGAPDPVGAHLLTIRLLDIAEEARLLRYVMDDSRYWENRDDALLAARHRKAAKARTRPPEGAGGEGAL